MIEEGRGKGKIKTLSTRNEKVVTFSLEHDRLGSVWIVIPLSMLHFCSRYSPRCIKFLINSNILCYMYLIIPSFTLGFLKGVKPLGTNHCCGNDLCNHPVEVKEHWIHMVTCLSWCAQGVRLRWQLSAVSVMSSLVKGWYKRRPETLS